jgi:aryl carrier-like protein
MDHANTRSAAEISGWLIAYVARLLEFEPEEVKTGIPLGRYGLDSIAAAALTGELSKFLGSTVDPAVLYQHRTIAALSAFLGRKEGSK